MSSRLPEPSAFKDPAEKEFMNQLLRVLRNSIGDNEKDIADNTTALETDITDLTTEVENLTADGDRGDISVTDDFMTWTIDNEAVTYIKMQEVSATDKILGRETAGAGVVEEIDCTAFGRSLIDDADASAGRTTLELGSAALEDVGTGANEVVQLDGTGKLPAVDGSALINLPGPEAAYYVYTVSAGTNGPTYTSGAFRTVVINTEVSDPNGIGSLSSNQITLGAGTYLVQAWCNVQAATGNVSTKTRIYNVTDTATLVVGPSAFQSSNQSADANPPLIGMFTIAGTKAIEFQIRVSTNTTAITAPNLGEDEVYTQLTLLKIA
jgi:hypothetical protein